MRKFKFIVFLFFVLFACEDREPDPVTIPYWLEPRIEELETDGCIGCSVRRVTYNDEFYYHVYCSYWSCSHCEVYHYNGDLVDWAETDFADYLANQSRSVIIWECKTDTVAP